ncbi:GNAT family N-acetyltransferase [Shewanella sp. ULN5]|uniref:GNAT family N-acetyltransferase n=1 Tax=Shewanella sp. ULN5 TaxID=2994678 RepID=UPI00273E210A|nr:GNAT family N-acetyltransferase [Shewanella sp. ULN5]MDP5144878.1 GNAT family N-acetyltransferase [Shewanella sp. ULN5]
MNLVLPSIEYQYSYHSYINELGNEERYPFVLDFDYQDFDTYLTKVKDFSQGINLPNGYVPSSTFWLIHHNEIVGVTNLRHYLNDQIKHCGGHIGLSIRPSKRGTGLGILLMKRSIEKLHSMGNNPLHIHCYEDNLASERAIVSNGGVFDSAIQSGSQVVKRFIIDLT